MKTQIIQGHNGLPAGVFIPIEDWENIKKKYPDIENDEDNVPQWQKDIVLRRLEAIKQNPDLLIDEEQFWKDLENEG